MKMHPLNFPVSTKTYWEPMKIEVMEMIAGARLVLRANVEQYNIPLYNAKNLKRNCAQVGIKVTHSADTFLATTSARKDEEKLEETQEYLKTHGLVEYMQGLLHAVIKSRPKDPYRYMMQQLASAVGMSQRGEVPPAPEGPRLPDVVSGIRVGLREHPEVEQLKAVEVVNSFEEPVPDVDEELMECLEKEEEMHAKGVPPNPEVQEAQFDATLVQRENENVEEEEEEEELELLKLRARTMFTAAERSGDLQEVLTRHLTLQPVKDRVKGILFGALESGKLQDFVTNKSSLPRPEKGSGIVGDEMRVADAPLKDSLVGVSGGEVLRDGTPDHAAATKAPAAVQPPIKGEQLTWSQAAEKIDGMTVQFEALKKDNTELRTSMNEMIGMLNEMLKA